MKLRKLITSSAAALLISGVLGCGGASNDQGVAFTFLGYFAPDDTGGCDSATDTGISGVVVGLSNSDFTGATPGDLEGVPENTASIGCARVQNNISTVGIRVQRVFLSYRVEGATEQPPSTSFPLGVVLGPGPTGGVAGSLTSPSSSLPPGFAGVGNVSTAAVALISPEVFTWLNLNRAQLPEPPFTMVVTSYVVGITTAGDQLTTNPVDLYVQVTPDLQIPPASVPGGTAGDAGAAGSTTGDTSTDGLTSGSADSGSTAADGTDSGATAGGDTGAGGGSGTGSTDDGVAP